MKPKVPSVMEQLAARRKAARANRKPSTRTYWPAKYKVSGIPKRPYWLDVVEAAIADGCTMRAAAALAGVGERTLYHYLDRAERAGIETFRTRCLNVR